MAWKQTDIDTLKKAIASGASKVRFADGREVTYRSLSDMRSTLKGVEQEVAGAAGARPSRYVAGYVSNLS